MPSCSQIHAHARDQLVKIHGAKAEVLAARRNGRRNLVRFRGAEHENGPGRRLFDGLQQRVEGFVGDLVRFVDDEDFVAVARRLIAHVLAQFAHFVDAAIGGGVDFDHVHRPARRDLPATRAHPAGLDSWVRSRSSGSGPGCAPRWSCRFRAAPKRCSRARCGSARWRSRSVVLTCSWFTTSANDWGRYFRAMTWYMGGRMPGPG